MSEFLKPIISYFDPDKPHNPATKKQKLAYILALFIIVAVIATVGWVIPEIRRTEERKKEEARLAVSIDNLIKNSHGSQSAGKFKEAKETLDTVIEKDPENYYAYYRRGLAYLYLGYGIPEESEEKKRYYKEGKKDADKAIEKNDGYEKAKGGYDEYAPYYLKALCLYGLKEDEDAIIAIDVAIRQNGGNAAYFELRAKAYARLEKREEAGDDRMKAAEIHLAEGLFSKALENYNKALTNYEKAKDSAQTQDDRILFDQKANQAKDKAAKVTKTRQ